LNDDDELDYAEFDDDKNADRGGGGLGRGASGLASYATTRLHKDRTHSQADEHGHRHPHHVDLERSGRAHLLMATKWQKILKLNALIGGEGGKAQAAETSHTSGGSAGAGHAGQGERSAQLQATEAAAKQAKNGDGTGLSATKDGE
jgi:hypothetical protein